MGTNSYQKVSLWKSTYKILKERHSNINKEAKSFGRKYNIPFTKFIHIIAKDSKVTLSPYDIRRIINSRNGK